MAWKRGSMSFSENTRPFAPKGGPVWYSIKAGELILVGSSLLLLLVAHATYPVKDNFSTSYSCNDRDDQESTTISPPTDNPNNNPNNEEQIRSSGYYNAVSPIVNKYEDQLINDCWHYDGHPKIIQEQNTSVIPLGLLLVLYVTCVTIMVAVLVELISLLLKDPVNKCPNILLNLLYVSLSSIMFFISLFAAIKSSIIILIILCLLSGILTVLTVLDLVVLLYS